MKKFLLSLACVAFVSVPAFAGSCPMGAGCGGEKPKDGDKPKEPATQTLTLRVQE